MNTTDLLADIIRVCDTVQFEKRRHISGKPLLWLDVNINGNRHSSSVKLDKIQMNVELLIHEMHHHLFFSPMVKA